MKNVFAYRDAAPEGGVFLSRSPEGGLAARKKASDKEAERFGRQAMLPIVWQSVFLLVFCVGLLLLTVGLDLLTEEDFKGNETIGVVLAAVGGAFVIHETLSLGTVLSFLQYSRSFTQPLTNLSQQFKFFKTNRSLTPVEKLIIWIYRRHIRHNRPD